VSRDGPTRAAAYPLVGIIRGQVRHLPQCRPTASRSAAWPAAVVSRIGAHPAGRVGSCELLSRMAWISLSETLKVFRGEEIRDVKCEFVLHKARDELHGVIDVERGVIWRRIGVFVLDGATFLVE
jgi:hypothetical protein